MGDTATSGVAAEAAEQNAFCVRLVARRRVWEASLEALIEGDDRSGRSLAQALRSYAGEAAEMGFDLLAEELSACRATVQGALVLGHLEPASRRQIEAALTRTFRYAEDQLRGPKRKMRASSLRVWMMAPGAVADGLIAEEWVSEDDAPGLRIEALPERGLEVKMGHMPPDVCIVDAEQEGAESALDTLLGEAEFPVLVLGTFERSEDSARYVVRGASEVIAKPVSPTALRRAIFEAAPVEQTATEIGRTNVGRLSLRLASELQKGLSDAVDASSRKIDFDLKGGADELTVLWEAVARIRDLVTAKSGGKVRFETSGPMGALPRATWLTKGYRKGADRRPPNQEVRRVEGDLMGCVALVAEDDLSVNWFLAGVLRDAGADVMSARTGREALDMAYRRTPDVVLADVIMPELDGLSLCRIFKRDVLMRSVPLLVLSWKDDLLQRMRELGAEADGFLRKQAEDREVLQRVSELMGPRRALRSRLERGGDVQGRLDGLTAVGLVRLLGQLQPDCQLSLRDAHHVYELSIRGGRPVVAMRTDEHGQTERGPMVMAALLGIGAGRFGVRAVDPGEPLTVELSGTLEEQLFDPLCRVRAAQRRLMGGALAEVERVGIAPARLGLALEATPEPARSLLEAFAGGASPAALMASGDVSSDLAERVLAYAARCGAVTEILVEGQDVLPSALHHQRAVANGEEKSDVAPLAQPLAFVAEVMAAQPAEESQALDESGPIEAEVAPADDSMPWDDDAGPWDEALEEALEDEKAIASGPIPLAEEPLEIVAQVTVAESAVADDELDEAPRLSRELAGPFGEQRGEEGSGQTPVLASAVEVADHARRYTPMLATVADKRTTDYAELAPLEEPPKKKELAEAVSGEEESSREAKRKRRDEEEEDWTPTPTPARRRRRRRRREEEDASPVPRMPRLPGPSAWATRPPPASEPKKTSMLWPVAFGLVGVGLAVGARFMREQQPAAPPPAAAPAPPAMPPGMPAQMQPAPPEAPPARGQAPTQNEQPVKRDEPQLFPLTNEEADRVKPGQGLLEVVASKSAEVHVAGKRVGHGPVVRLPVEAKEDAYEVRVKMRGEERVRYVRVVEGKRIRLRVAPPWSH